jgi:hypothetical protein
MELEKEVFPGKKLSDLVKEVYDRQHNQDSSIRIKIDEISDMIEGPGDAIVLMPQIKGLIDSSLKNDEVLVKLLGLFQKASQAAQKENEMMSELLSEKDIEQLMKEVNVINSTAKTITDK